MTASPAAVPSVFDAKVECVEPARTRSADELLGAQMPESGSSVGQRLAEHDDVRLGVEMLHRHIFPVR